jgi:hypothetical protein
MLMRILGAALSVSVLFLGAALWRVAQGPVEVNFLGAYVQEMLTDGTPGYIWSFERTIIDWTDFQPSLDISITGVEVREKSGVLVAQAPRLDIGLSPRGLLQGRLAPTSVELESASLLAVRLLDGSFRLGFAAGPEDLKKTAMPDFMGLLSAAFAGLLEPPGAKGNLGALEHFAIRDVTLAYRDLRLETLWEASGASFTFERSRRGITGEAAIGLKIAGQTWALAFSGNFDRDTQQSHIGVTFKDIEPFQLAQEAKALEPLSGLRLPLSGSVGAQLARDGQIISLSANLHAGPGEIASAALLAQPVRVDRLEASGEYTLGDNTIRFDALRLMRGPLQINASGAVEYGVPSPAIALSGDITNATLEEVKQLWPLPLAKGSRGWFLENMEGGMVSEAHFETHIQRGENAAGPLRDEAISATLRFSDVTGHYFRPMPPISRARGNAHITGRKFELNLDEGVVLDDLHVNGGKFELFNTHLPEKQGQVTLTVDGSMTRTLELIDSPPLGYPSKFGIDPTAIGGAAKTVASLRFPVKSGTRMNEISYEVTSEVKDLRFPDILNGIPLEQGKMIVKVDREGVAASGTARLLDVEAELSWTESFNVKSGPSSSFDIKARADERQLEALGFPTAGLISGPVALSVRAKGRGKNISGGHVTGDLTGTELIALPLSWRKPKGVPATIDFDFVLPEGSGAELKPFAITGREIDVAGGLTFDRDGPPRTIRLHRVKLGAANDLRVNAHRRKNGFYAIAVNGESADLSSSIKEFRTPGAGRSPEDKGVAYDIEARLEKVMLRESHQLERVIAVGVYDGFDFLNLAVDGGYGPDDNVALRLQPEAGNRKFTLVSQNAGKILYGLDLFDSGVKGDLEMRGEFLDSEVRSTQGSAVMQGDIRIRNMQVVNAPALTRLLTLASLTGIRDVLTGSGLTFSRIIIPFRTAEGVTTLKDAYGSGSEIGFTLEGTMNDARGTVDLSGTVIPAYTLNTVFGKVPLLGKILLGGSNQGVFAINYSASGPSDNADIFVNPLSALTPGFLRKIFNLGDLPAQEGEGAPAPADAP